MSFSRENRSHGATITRCCVYASGSNMNVYKGVYTLGERTGEECVSKIFKSGSVFEDAFFDAELKVVEDALTIINLFNSGNIINSTIFLNQPEVWTYTDDEKTLVEPMIQNFEKFNSNTGWTPREINPWMEVMQALSHFSYHVTNETMLLCDLQGGVYKDGFVLTDPVVMSETGEFGPTDLGQAGIDTFFSRHKCNQYCSRRGWLRPQNVRAHYAAQQGTSMEMAMAVPTRHTRAPLSRRQPQHQPQHQQYYPYNPPIQEYHSSDSDSY
jgi:hypothetical protein